MRLDRFLSLQGFGSRKSTKKIVRDHRIKINGVVAAFYDMDIKGTDKIELDDKEIPNLPYVTIMLNKPENYMCSMIDEAYPSVMNLIDPLFVKRVRIVGRLDADTTGLLLFTDNGVLNSRLTNPKSKIDKTYDVEVNHLLKPSLVDDFNQSIDIGQGDITAPSKLVIKDEYHASITVHEGKYHEIKRLFGHFSYDVIKLNRASFGPLSLDKNLKPGESRLITEEEYESLLKATHLEKKDLL